MLKCVLWLQRKSDEDKKNRADDMKFSHSRQMPVKEVLLCSHISLEYSMIRDEPDFGSSFGRSCIRPFVANPARAKFLAGFPDFWPDLADFSTAAVCTDYLRLKVMKPVLA